MHFCYIELRIFVHVIMPLLTNIPLEACSNEAVRCTVMVTCGYVHLSVLCVCALLLSVSPYYLLITITQHYVHVMTFSKSWVERSRSGIDSHRNLVNLIAPELVKIFEPELTQVFPTVWPRTDYHVVLKIMGLKIKVTEIYGSLSKTV